LNGESEKADREEKGGEEEAGPARREESHGKAQARRPQAGCTRTGGASTRGDSRGLAVPDGLKALI